MFQADKKFKKEIQAVRDFKGAEDALSVAEMAVIRQKVMAAAAAAAKQPVKQFFWTEKRTRVARYIVSALLGVSLVGGTAFASNSSLPGGVLYPLKRVKEKVELSLKVSEQSKAELQSEFAQERLSELLKLTAENGPADALEDSGQPTSSSTQESLDEKNASSSGATIQLSGQATVVRGLATKTLVKLKKANNGNSKLEIEARQEAGIEVNDALTVLQQVETKLRTQGKAQGAAAIAQNILQLQNKAEAQNIEIITKDEAGSNDGQNNNPGSVQGTSTVQGQIQTPQTQDQRGNGKGRGTEGNTLLKVDGALNGSLELK